MKHKDTKKDTSPVRTSLYLPPSFVAALNLIRQKERVMKSHQIEMGLKMYFEKHRELLLANGIDVWQEE